MSVLSESVAIVSQVTRTVRQNSLGLVYKMSTEEGQEINQDNNVQFEEKRDKKGRRITKKRMESMKKNLANANKSRIAKKQMKSQIDEYEIEHESESGSDVPTSSDSDDELLEKAMTKPKPIKKEEISNERIDRLENALANLAQSVKKSHKQLKKSNKPAKSSDKILVFQPKNNQPVQVQAPKKGGSQMDRTDQLIDLLKNNIMF